VEKFRAAAGMVLAHHEQFDGNGYPNGLAGDSIPLGARIFAVADTLDAITSARPYRSGLSFAAAREEIALEAGMQFDPAVVEAYLSVPRTVWHEIWDRSVARTQRPLAELPLVVL
jgi:HD-GYP domain-containing protein (c-di-GMP phosphodiesterase class II)